MTNKLISGILPILLILHFSCHRSKLHKTDQGKNAVRADSAASESRRLPGDTTGSEISESYDIEEIDFNYLTARSKVSFKNRSQNYDNANVNLRIRKDSLIWFSITGLGLEVARGIISKDSILVVDKFHREYYAYGYEQISRQFNFKLDYTLIQSVITGNLPLPRRPGQKIKKEKDYLLLHQEEGRVLVDNYIGEQNRKLKKLQAVEQPTKNSLTLDYEDFKELNNYLFPYTSLITLDIRKGKERDFYQTVIRLKHAKVELKNTHPGFPFSVPSGYKKK